MTHKIDAVLREASTGVLETMFFAEVEAADSEDAVHSDATACLLHCSGAESGTFSVAIDRPALKNLCCAFYGEDDDPSPAQEEELICELTNMLAGSTLSAYVPEHFCKLTAPVVYDIAGHIQLGSVPNPEELQTTVNLALDGGLLSVSCSLKVAHERP